MEGWVIPALLPSTRFIKAHLKLKGSLGGVGTRPPDMSMEAHYKNELLRIQ